MHWYNFMAIGQGLKKGEKIRFNIRNLMRPKSLYSDGMLPKICYDEKGWHCDPNITTEIKFFQTDQKDNFDKQFYFKEKVFSTMSFVYVVQNANERIKFAYDKPYTYSGDLKAFIDKIRNNQKYQDIL